MMRGLFVTGAGTDVGKTTVAAGLLRMLRAQGLDAVPMKPVQTGARRDEDGTLNAPDLDVSLAAAGLSPDAAERARMSPCLFEPACSPHLAARLYGRLIDAGTIFAAAQWLSARHDALVVEGAGGVLVPIGEGRTMADLMVCLAMPVVLVSPGGLGAINHALLSIEAIRSRGLRLLGVVMTETHRVPEVSRYIHEDNVRTIAEAGKTKILARIPYLGTSPDWAAIDTALGGCQDILEYEEETNSP
ncbi:MAG TPA: dethiobiotin synthase [Candidatus Deferrimicrobiaceae bacterium]|jgi:dethiobiotin synthase